MNYYYFYQQCKDYFEISRVPKINPTLFATLFLYSIINFQWI